MREHALDLTRKIKYLDIRQAALEEELITTRTTKTSLILQLEQVLSPEPQVPQGREQDQIAADIDKALQEAGVTLADAHS